MLVLVLIADRYDARATDLPIASRQSLVASIIPGTVDDRGTPPLSKNSVVNQPDSLENSRPVDCQRRQSIIAQPEHVRPRVVEASRVMMRRKKGGVRWRRDLMKNLERKQKQEGKGEHEPQPFNSARWMRHIWRGLSCRFSSHPSRPFYMGTTLVGHARRRSRPK